LSAHEDIEEAWLTARTASWRAIPDGDGWARLQELDRRRWDEINPWNPWNRGPPLTADEEAEFRALRTLYATHGVDRYDLPFVGDSNIRNITKTLMKLRFEKYPLVEDVEAPGR
jgi:hypothetical protein